MGELLFRVAGTSGRVQTSGGEDDEGVSTETQGRLLLEALGEEGRAEVLAATYIARSDVGLTVRAAALHVWKTLVVNTPRTLGEVLPQLMRLIIAALAAGGADQRATASRCLGELVKKLAERVLPSIIPILRAGLGALDPASRAGVCLGLSEVLGSATRLQLADHYGQLIPAVQQALCDESPAVRAAAGAAFNQLFRGGGGSGGGGDSALSEIVPALLASLEGGGAHALEGLKQVLRAQPRLLSAVVPRLAAPPLSAANAAALGAVCQAAGASLPALLPLLFPPLLEACEGEGEGGGEVGQASRHTLLTISLCVDEPAQHLLLAELLRGMEDRGAGARAAAAALAGAFLAQSQLEVASSLPPLAAALVGMLADPSPGVVRSAWEALGQATARIPKEELHCHVRTLRDAVAGARERQRRRARSDVAAPVLVAGFSLPKGLSPILPIYLAGVLTGGAEARAAAAEGLGELLEVTGEEGLRAHVVAIAGPLIRVVSDKHSPEVKACVLQTLVILLHKGGTALKPFLPQLQTSCVRSLADPSRAVRTRAVEALRVLMRLQTRVDPLLAELLCSLQEGEGGHAETTVAAISAVLGAAGALASEPLLARTLDELRLASACAEAEVAQACAAGLGVASPPLPDALFVSLWEWCITTPAPDLRPARTATLAAVLGASASRAAALPGAEAALLGSLRLLAADERGAVRECVCTAVGAWLQREGLELGAAAAPFSQLLRAAMADESSDVRRRALGEAARAAGARAAPELAAFAALLLPAIVAALDDAAGPVKAASERALRTFVGAGLDLAAVGGAQVRSRLTPALMRRLLAPLDE